VAAFTAGKNPSTVSILVPGCGLGRLVWEFCHRGYVCQGNECSMFMLIASQFIINSSETGGQHALHPFLATLTNVRDAEDMLREVRIPDVLPSDLPAANLMSMCAGDFVEVYSKAENKAAFDVVVTCFFIVCPGRVPAVAHLANRTPLPM
jgi:carnosine N-methyltransferase